MPDEQLTELKEQQHHAAKEVSTLAKGNSALIGKFRGLLAQAKAARVERDALNSKANELRKKKDTLLTELKALFAQLDEATKHLKEARESGGSNAGRIHAELQRLEWEQMTEALSPAQEKALAKRIREIRKMLPTAAPTQTVTTGSNARELRAKINPMKKELDSVRHEFEAARKGADAKHKEALECSKQADALSKEIGENINKLGEKRTELEHSRKQFTNVISSRRREERDDKAALESMKRRQQEKITSAARKLAEKIREKLKAGGKLTAEEFLVLQQAEN